MTAARNPATTLHDGTLLSAQERFFRYSMMAEVPDNFDSSEVDEPTQPYTRKEIDQLRGRLAVVATSADVLDVEVEVEAEWFEVEGRRIRLSLDSLAHIGFSGGSPRMISSAQSSCVSGEIGAWDALDEDAFEYGHRGRRRALWVIGGTLALALVFVLRAPWSSSVPQDEPIGARADVLPEPTPPPEPTPEPAPRAAPTTTAVNPELPSELAPTLAPEPTKRRAEAATPACAAHRKNAGAAADAGDWAKLETLAKQTKCWPRVRDSKVLLLRALFELDRFEECVERSKNDRSKEIVKWQKNCSRALQ